MSQIQKKQLTIALAAALIVVLALASSSLMAVNKTTTSQTGCPMMANAKCCAAGQAADAKKGCGTDGCANCKCCSNGGCCTKLTGKVTTIDSRTGAITVTIPAPAKSSAAKAAVAGWKVGQSVSLGAMTGKGCCGGTAARAGAGMGCPMHPTK